MKKIKLILLSLISMFLLLININVMADNNYYNLKSGNYLTNLYDEYCYGTMVFKTWDMSSYYNEISNIFSDCELNIIEFSFKDSSNKYVFKIKVVNEDDNFIHEIYFLDELVNKIYIKANGVSSDNIMLKFNKTINFSEYQYNSDVSSNYSSYLKGNINRFLKIILKPYYESIGYDEETNYDNEYFYVDEYESNSFGKTGTALNYYWNKYDLNNSFYLLNEYTDYGICIFIKNGIRYNAKYYLYDKEEFKLNDYNTSYKNKLDKNNILNTYNPNYEIESKTIESEYFNSNDLGRFTYKITFNLKNNIKIESAGYITVYDDVKPILEGENNISTLEGEILTEEYIKSLFYVYDDYDDEISSKLELIDYDKIDFNIAGDYYIKIKASDNFNNESIEDIKISVFKKAEPDPDPIEPEDPIEPTNPTEPEEPTNPVEPEEPENKMEPDNPVDPIDNNAVNNELDNQEEINNNENVSQTDINNDEEIIINNDEEIIIDDISIKDDFIEVTNITLEGSIDKKYDKFDLLNMLKNSGLNISSDCEISSSYFDDNNLGLYEIKIEDNGKTYLAYLKIKNEDNNFNPTIIIILSSITLIGIGLITFLIIKKKMKS